MATVYVASSVRCFEITFRSGARAQPSINGTLLTVRLTETQFALDGITSTRDESVTGQKGTVGIQLWRSL